MFGFNGGASRHHGWWAAVLRGVLLALFLAALGAGPVLAQSGGGEIPSFDFFLQSLSGPLVASAVGLVLSWVVEYWPKFGELAPRWKRLVYFGLCLILPLSAASLRALLGYVAWSFDPLLWHALWAGAAAGGIGTLAHARQLSGER